MSYSQQLVAERYRLLSQIGSGGMGRVWLARDEVLHRDVAVKEVVLPLELTDQEREELFQRTLREARAAGRLSHPNVVGVYDVVQAEGRPWIVMELVRSRSLYQVVKEDGPLSPRRTAEVGLSVLAALLAAHQARVWHRDVKPGNVLLAEDGRVVLTDFGLATFDGDGTVTRAGIILGSAQYISPERARDGASGPESDMWSLGATLYAAVEGRSPFARETSMATLTALATVPPDTPRRAGPLRPVLIGLLRKNPRHRMRPIEVEKLLRRIVDGNGKGLAGRKAGRVPPQRPGAVLEEDEYVPNGAAASGWANSQEAKAWEDESSVDESQGLRLRTVTEETFRQVRRPRRRWALVWGLVAVAAALATPGVVILLDASEQGTGTVVQTPSAGPSTSALGEAARVQACANQPADKETILTEPVPADRQKYGLLENWTYYPDPSGFHVRAPVSWGASRIGALLCLRDPSSAKTVAVYSHGPMEGNVTSLVDQHTDPWVEAAKLANYERVSITNVNYPEGAADMEYRYRQGNIVMHGVNRMLRMEGKVYTIYFIAPEVSWASDRDFANVALPSFGLDR